MHAFIKGSVVTCMPLHAGMVDVFCLFIYFSGGTKIGKGGPLLAAKISPGE